MRRCWSKSISEHVYSLPGARDDVPALEYPHDKLAEKLFIAIWEGAEGHLTPASTTEREWRERERERLMQIFGRLCKFNWLSKLANRHMSRVGCLHVFAHNPAKNFDNVDRSIYLKCIVDRAAESRILGFSLQKFLRKMYAEKQREPPPIHEIYINPHLNNFGVTGPDKNHALVCFETNKQREDVLRMLESYGGKLLLGDSMPATISRPCTELVLRATRIGTVVGIQKMISLKGFRRWLDENKRRYDQHAQKARDAAAPRLTRRDVLSISALRSGESVKKIGSALKKGVESAVDHRRLLSALVDQTMHDNHYETVWDTFEERGSTEESEESSSDTRERKGRSEIGFRDPCSGALPEPEESFEQYVERSFYDACVHTMHGEAATGRDAMGGTEMHLHMHGLDQLLKKLGVTLVTRWPRLLSR